MSNGPNSYQLDDVMYYLTRLEGQLVRLNTVLSSDSYLSPGQAVVQSRDIVHAAQAFAQSLRNALSGNRIDVA